MSSNQNSENAQKTEKDKDKQKLEFGVLADDDEFEEFPAEDFSAKDDDSKDLDVWEDNWDDDNVEDDFGVQLRSELEKQKIKPAF